MWQKILVTLDTTKADQTILDYLKPLVRQFGSRLVLLHVADGWAARTYGADAVSPEITEDRAYLSRITSELQAEGVTVEAELAFGNPPDEIVRWVKQRQCDLVAMSTHGHRALADFFLGTTAHRVQHQVDVPVLLVKAKG